MNGIQVYDDRKELINFLSSLKKDRKTIGFVPTMGALHEGHLALVRKAMAECNHVVVSIFVNPTQFNNPEDLKNYPRTLDKDIEQLALLGSIIVFSPGFKDVYPDNDDFPGVELHGLDKVLEGKFRPGHFLGVVHVVYNLFTIIQPDKAYFGLKDYQQLAIIKHMVNQLNLPVQIVPCPTLREKNGLAMSSRNMRLSSEEKSEALIIPDTLNFARELSHKLSPLELKKEAIKFFSRGTLKLEYLEIVDARSLESLTEHWIDGAVCCIAAYCGDVRLIDNMILR